MRTISTILATVGLLAVLMTGCGDSYTDIAPVYNTDHPDKAKVIFNTTWPLEIPEVYSAFVGHSEAELSGAAAEFPELLDEGNYHYVLFNNPAGISFGGFVASVVDVAGYAASPGFLYSKSGDMELKKDTEHNVSVTLVPLVRQLNMKLSFSSGSPGEITGLSAEITGIARNINTDNGEISGQVRVKPDFVLEGNEYKASHNLLGVVGDVQIITMTLTSSEGTVEVSGDMTAALAEFNDDKTKSLDVELTISDLDLSAMTLEVTAWNEGEIRGGAKEEPVLDKQVTIDWPSMSGRIDAVELYDRDMKLYASLVENDETVGLYELPAEIYMIRIYHNDICEEVTLNVLSYDRESGALVMTDDYNIGEPWHFGIIKDMAGKYSQIRDIDCADIVIDPIGWYVSDSDYNAFTGTFDGAGYKISNLTLSKMNDCGLIVMNQGTIKNVVIESGTIGDNATLSNVGAICAMNFGTIENCINKANVSANMYAGGIVGKNSGQVIACSNFGAILANTYSGGIAGENYKDYSVSRCANEGDVKGMQRVGGIVGGNQGNISESTNKGTVTCTQSYAGGATGYNQGGTITGVRNEGAINGGSTTGGIAGYNSTGKVEGAVNEGDVGGGATIGGIIGQSTGMSMLSDCENKGVISGRGQGVGGIAGSNTNSTINGCMNRGAVQSTAGNIGGIVGQGATNSTIFNCGNFGNILSGGSYAGGIAGTHAGTITACRNAGDISDSVVYTGGIAGAVNSGNPTTACYNTGKISGFSNLGGIIGSQSSNAILKGVYSTGDIISSHPSRSGAIVGYNQGIAKIYAAYWDYSYINYWEDLGVIYAIDPHGMGQNLNSNVDQVVVSRFNYDAENPSSTVWPVDDHANGWGVVGAGKTFDEGYYWLSLGDPATDTYPTLWWE